MNIGAVIFRVVIVAAVCTLAVGVYAQRAGDEAVAVARAYFRTNASEFGLADPDRELSVRSVRYDGNRAVIRFDQYYEGLKVFEGEAIARVINGRVEVTSALRDALQLETRPYITNQNAIEIALRAIAARGFEGPSRSRADLKVLPRGPRSGVDILVWHVRLDLESAERAGTWEYFVDARSGAAVWSFDALQTLAAFATGKTMYSGDVALDVTSVGTGGGGYSLMNPLQGAAPGNSTNNMSTARIGQGKAFTSAVPVFGNNDPGNTDGNTAGADAHYGLTTAWRFFQSVFLRNGADGSGRSIYQRIHYGQNYENAFWNTDCFCITYGDGASLYYPLVSLDTTAHEVTHGVTATEANFTYSGESGALNESTSDIFGTVIEFFANNPADTPDYWLGEREVRSNYASGGYTQTSARRYMDFPARDGKSVNCWYPGIDIMDVHYSSGPNNHMFYLLAHGGTSACNGQLVSGIGNEKAARIWYDALTSQMTSSTNYHGARKAAVASASTLYGLGSTEYDAVEMAFSAIDVNPSVRLNPYGRQTQVGPYALEVVNRDLSSTRAPQDLKVTLRREVISLCSGLLFSSDRIVTISKGLSSASFDFNAGHDSTCPRLPITTRYTVTRAVLGTDVVLDLSGIPVKQYVLEVTR
jgi:zinc metalloprotease ZmpA